jgi:hypothetical protein
MFCALTSVNNGDGLHKGKKGERHNDKSLNNNGIQAEPIRSVAIKPARRFFFHSNNGHKRSLLAQKNLCKKRLW